MALETYHKKRDFAQTTEPSGKTKRRSVSTKKNHSFVVQKHAASHLHYDFRLELDEVLKSWAVPKGPHLDPKVKSLAVEVEDHPLEYASFEGTIPAGQYGGGTVMVWDRGTWQTDDDPQQSLKKGKLTFELHGKKLRGGWSLVRMHDESGSDKHHWLLIKKQDEAAQTKRQGDILQQEPLSVLSGRDLDEIAAGEKAKLRTKSKKGAINQQPAKPGTSAQVKSPVRKPRHLEPASEKLAQAKPLPLPNAFAPQLATLAGEVPEGDDWLHEVKYDGYRLIAILNQGRVKLLTRAGNDWTDRFPKLAEELQQQDVETAIFDGEVVVLNQQGISDFQRLQNWLKNKRTGTLAYFVFDMPYLNGVNLQQVPLELRKRMLEKVLADKEDTKHVVRYGGHILGQGQSVVEQACKLQAEGIVSKRVDSTYQQRRSRDWLKIKCSHRQEFVIAGYTKPKGARTGFGALLLAYYDGHNLVYCGRVGTGFNESSLRQLASQLKERQRIKQPLSKMPIQERGNDVIWVEPDLVCEVQFTEWSDDGLLRHPSFQGLREDKPAREVKREQSSSESAHARQKSSNASSRASRHSGQKQAKVQPVARMSTAQKKKSARTSTPLKTSEEVAGVRLTHPDRVLYPETGLTKFDLATFYHDIGDWILPHLINRPLTVVRCPDGRAKACFYQKHLTTPMPEQVQGIQIKEKSKTDRYMLIEDLSGLIALVQMGVLEFHPWPARADNLERPDRLIFDLDPAEGVAWVKVIEAAQYLHAYFDVLGLENYVRTSGGKGLHIVVPLSRRNTWGELKSFSHAVARAMEREAPDRYVATMSKAKRRGKIFIDYLRNQRGATSIASYSTRARVGSPIATPLRWSELTERIAGDHFKVANLQERINKLKADPWAGFFQARQSLTKSLLRSVVS